jgi:hypothetical protein
MDILCIHVCKPKFNNFFNGFSCFPWFQANVLLILFLYVNTIFALRLVCIRRIVIRLHNPIVIPCTLISFLIQFSTGNAVKGSGSFLLHCSACAIFGHLALQSIRTSAINTPNKDCKHPDHIARWPSPVLICVLYSSIFVTDELERQDWSAHLYNCTLLPPSKHLFSGCKLFKRATWEHARLLIGVQK